MLDDERIAELITSTRQLRHGFAATAPRRWDAATAGAELAVQLGHVALCLLKTRGADVASLEDPRRPITDVGDELADVALSGVSVTVLAETTPGAPRGDRTADDEMEGFLRLVVAAGTLAEAAMIQEGYRHRPTGDPAPVGTACASTLAATYTLAEHFGLDLLDQFRNMTVHAERFLDAYLDEGVDDRADGPA